MAKTPNYVKDALQSAHDYASIALSEVEHQRLETIKHLDNLNERRVVLIERVQQLDEALANQA
jgi:hypothetical protein